MSVTTMPTIDIYVQDVSYVEPFFSGTREVFIPLLAPKGPEEIKLMTSPSEIERTYGKPDPEKYSFGLHMALKASLYTNNVYILRVLPDDAAFANKVTDVAIQDYSPNPTVSANATDATEISLNGVSGIAAGDKIVFGSDVTHIYTVTAVDTSNNNITIDKPATVSSGVAVHKVPEITLTSISGANDVSAIDGVFGSDANAVFVFYPVGRGEYYNRIKLLFVRNTTLEQMFVDDNGNPLFPYMFVDIYVYEEKDDGDLKLLEGPHTVSLVPKINGQTVRSLTSGRELFIATRINQDSEFIRVAYNPNTVDNLYGTGAGDVEATLARKLLIESFASPTSLENGSDGSLFDSYGHLNFDVVRTLISSVYDGTYSDECSKLLDTQFMYYKPDYVVDWSNDLTIKSAIREFCDVRKDVLGLISMPDNSNYSQDVDSRLNDVPYNTYNVMLYSQYRQMVDPYTGKEVWFPPTYHALECHLNTDNTLGVAEPVAMYKAAIQDPIKLRYEVNFAQANELTNRQVNPTVKTPDGTFIPTQFTAYKRLSILQRAHTVKVLHVFRKEIPTILKDLLQRKATTRVVKEAERRVRNYLKDWVEGGPLFTKEALKWFKLNVNYSDEKQTLFINIDLKFIGSIEHIVVSINVR